MKVGKIMFLFLIITGICALSFANTDEELEDQFNELWDSGNFNDVVKLGMQGVSLALDKIDQNLDTLNSDNPDLVSTLFDSDPEKMIGLVNDNPSENLLSDSVVREAYENAIGSSPGLIQESPKAFRQFAEEENFLVPDDLSSVDIINYNRFDETFRIRNSDSGNFIRISKNDLNGGEINQDGTITLSNGVRVIDNSDVERKVSGNFRVSALNSNSPARVSFAGEEFTSEDMIVGGREGENFVEVVDSNPIEYMTNDEGLSQRKLTQGRLTFEKSTGGKILGDDTELRYYDIVLDDNSNLNREEIIQTIKTQKELRLTSGVCGRDSANCVQQRENNNGDEIVNIKVGNNNNVDFSTYDNRERVVTVEEITDDSTLNVLNMFESQRLEYEVSKEETVLKSMPPSEENSLNLRTYHIGPNGKVNEHIYSNEEFGTSYEINSNSLGSQIDLEQFSEQYRDDIEKIISGDIDISGISNYGGNSIIGALNSVGLDSSLAFRKELGTLLGVEGVGSIDGNIELLNKLKDEDSLSEITSSNSIGTGFSYPEIFEPTGTNVNADEVLNCNSEGICRVGNNGGDIYTKVNVNIDGEEVTLYKHADGSYQNQFGDTIDPETGEKIGESVFKSRGFWVDEDVVTTNTQLYSPTQIEDDRWIGNKCSVGNECPIGKSGSRDIMYTKMDCGGTVCFKARDQEIFNENGELINENGEFIDRDGNLCDTACESSSFKEYFQGGELEREGVNEPTLSTREQIPLGIARSYGNVVNPNSGVWEEVHPTLQQQKDYVLGISRGSSVPNEMFSVVVDAANAAAYKADELGVTIRWTSGNRPTGTSSSNNHAQNGRAGNAIDFVLETSTGVRASPDAYAEVTYAAYEAGATEFGFGVGNSAGGHIGVGTRGGDERVGVIGSQIADRARTWKPYDSKGYIARDRFKELVCERRNECY